MSIQQMPDNVILFYREKDVHYQGEKDYYGFTNFSSHKITTRGLPRLLIGDGKVDQSKGYIMPNTTFEWKTSEHLFNAMKFTQEGSVNEELIKEVYNQPDPMKAKNFAGSKNGLYNVANWWYRNNYKEAGYNYLVMKWVVREKFNQNKVLKDLLVNTGSKKLVENSGKPKDKWGNGQKGNYTNLEEGNWLGKILMEIRDELALNQPKTDSNSPPQSPPFDTSQPNVSNGGSNSPDTNQNSPNNQSPNQGEQNNPNENGPIPNPPTNGDNHDPEKNDDSPLPNSDADIPPIDMSGINSAATTEQAQQEARTQIQQLFANSKVKPDDLDPFLWKNKNSWEEYLKELTTQSEIATFVKEIEKEIREKYQAQQNKNNDSSLDSSNKNKISVWLIASGVLSAVVIFSVLIFRRRKAKFSQKRNVKKL
ncbi:protein of unknown function [endosymbiont DhMRE of Dentiscutata heterogama]|uniref:NADAR family protein n=1 Tax=endosymbiont DhMRE of Dentiscutata heterogama TaxID=1609546 RepID=UPI000629D5AA|nr:NADAR domain-containing protein [endosymbiont DhMRE of Dentiscutata heterogama]CFW93192.1 protein of unknown function [endosymbiont DhMRE of Dentiscutata heterogama]